MIKLLKLEFSTRETEGKTVFSDPLTSPFLGPWPCLWTRVSESGSEVRACAPGAWRAGGGSFRVSVSESWGRVSMEPSVSISASGPDPGELMSGTPGLWNWGCFHLLLGLPTISSSSSLFSKRSSCSDSDSLREAAAQLSTRAGPLHFQVPVRVLCTEVMCRVRSLHTDECECEIHPRPRATEPGWDPRRRGDPLWSAGEESVWFVLEAGWGGVSITEDEMRWPCRRWRCFLHGHRPEGGDGISTAAPQETRKWWKQC